MRNRRVTAWLAPIVLALLFTVGYGVYALGPWKSSDSVATSASHPAVSHSYHYPSSVRITLAGIHSQYRPATSVPFILAARELKFVPDRSNNGHGRFVGQTPANSVTIRGTLISSKQQVSDSVYTYRVPIPENWRRSQHRRLYLFSNYPLIDSRGTQAIIEGYSIIYQTIEPVS